MSAQTSTTRAPQRQRQRRPKRQVKCELCGRMYRQITTTHLRSHGYTLDDYKRTFGSPVPPGPPSPPQVHAPQASTAQVADALLADQTFLHRLADDVGDLLFTTELRERLRLGLVQLLGKRLDLHAAAVANLERVRQELGQRWRVERGGKDGAPTPTPHLVMMAGEAHQEVTKSEEALLKAIKLAVEEQRSNKDLAQAQARPAYSGEAEAIPVPPSLPAHERETIRTLFSLLKDEAAARREPAAPPTPSSPELDPDVLEAPAPVQPPAEPFGLG